MKNFGRCDLSIYRLVCSKLEQKLDIHACMPAWSIDGTEILVLKKVYLTSTLSGQFKLLLLDLLFQSVRTIVATCSGTAER